MQRSGTERRSSGDERMIAEACDNLNSEPCPISKFSIL
jgi:hypothetical protein